MSRTPGTGEMRAAMRAAVKQSKGKRQTVEDSKAQWKKAQRQKKTLRSKVVLVALLPLACLCALYPLHTMGYFRLWKPGELSKALANPQVTEQLNLTHQYLSSVPDGIATLINLKSLTLDQNQIDTLSPDLFKLPRLQRLAVQYNRLSSVPADIENLSELQALNLSGNTVSALPPELFALKKLEELNLADNSLTSLPSDVGKLTSLKVLNLKKNNLSTLPESVSNLKNLERLNLTGNKLTSLPDLSGLKNLKNLALSGSGLSKDEINRLKSTLSQNTVVTQ